MASACWVVFPFLLYVMTCWMPAILEDFLTPLERSKGSLLLRPKVQWLNSRVNSQIFVEDSPRNSVPQPHMSLALTSIAASATLGIIVCLSARHSLAAGGSVQCLVKTMVLFPLFSWPTQLESPVPSISYYNSGQQASYPGSSPRECLRRFQTLPFPVPFSSVQTISMSCFLDLTASLETMCWIGL